MNTEDYTAIHASVSLSLISEDLRVASALVADYLTSHEVEDAVELASYLVGCSLAEVQAALRELGDKEGHEFHGNQWKGGHFHGTSAKVVDKILKEGLNPDTQNRVFMTNVLERAQSYAYSADDQHTGVVLEIRIPNDQKHRVEEIKSARGLPPRLIFRGRVEPQWLRVHSKIEDNAWKVLSASDIIYVGLQIDNKTGELRTAEQELKALEHSYASTQVNLPEPFRSEVLALAALIDDDDLAGDGRETNPHVTLRWGLHNSDPEGVINLLRGVGPIRVTLGGVSVFEAQPDAEDPIDVVKLTVASPDLVYLNGLLAQYLPHTQTHATYSPHVTLAYVKPGMGARYAGDLTLAGRSFVAHEVQFSNQDDEITIIPLDSIVRAAGDVEGHEFHGNQWTNGTSSSDDADQYLSQADKDRHAKQATEYKQKALGKLDKLANGQSSIPLSRVTKSFVANQRLVEVDRVRAFVKSYPDWGKTPVLTYHEGGKNKISDGHHRVAAAALLGRDIPHLKFEHDDSDLRGLLRAETLVHQAADAHAPGIGSDFAKAFQAGAQRVNRKVLASALASTKSSSVILRLVEPAVQATAEGLRLRLEDRLLKAVTSGGEAAASMLMKQLRAASDLRTLAPRPKMTLAWDPNHPAAKQWAKDHAAALITDISETTREYIRDEVERAFEEGTPITDVVDAIESVVNDADRAELIASTESMMAANEGQRQFWDQAIESGLMSGNEKREWIATGDNGVCDECDALDGTIVGVDEEYPDDGGDGPPLHPNCVTADSFVSAGGRIAACSERIYEGNLIIISTSSGKQLRCTPNHPILTSHGWIAARLVDKGTKVVSHFDRKRVFSCNKHDICMPTRIKEIADTYRISLTVASHEVKTSTKDFHGDGMEGQIAVINTNRFLRDAIKPKSLHAFVKFFFRFRLVFTFFFFGFSSILKSLDRLCASTNRFISRFSESINLFLSHFTKSSPVTLAYSSPTSISGSDLSFTLLGTEVLPSAERISATHRFNFTRDRSSTESNTGINQYLPNDTQTSVVPTRDTLESLVGKVGFDDIIDVETCSFSGQVYNLQTEHGWYIADGIITQNCRCTEGIVFGNEVE